MLWRPVVLVPLLALFLAPLALMLSQSLRVAGGPPARRIDWLPRPPAWENYPAVAELIPLGRFVANSLLVAAATVGLGVLAASLAGFALAQLPRRPRLRLTLLAFATLMIPASAVWVPRFVLFAEVGLLDTPAAIVLPTLAAGLPFWTLLFLWTFLRVPPAVYEAARLDGAGAVGVWGGIALPLARPTAAAVAMLAFVASWGNYVDPLLYIRTAEKQTLPYALQLLYQLDPSGWPLLMAGATVATLPAVAVFLAAQRAFLQQFRGSGWLER